MDEEYQELFAKVASFQPCKIISKWNLGIFTDQSLKIGEDTFGFNNVLYETFRTLSFKPIFLNEHIDRLVSSAKIIGLKRFYSKNQIYDMTVRVIEDFKKPDQLARIILVKEKLIIYTTALKLNQDIYNGVKTITCRADRNNPEIKATNYRVCLEAWKKQKRLIALKRYW